MKSARASLLAALLLLCLARLASATPSIVVDGDPSDWVGLPRLLTDPSGDEPVNGAGEHFPGVDVTAISVTNDDVNVYFLIEFAAQPMRGALSLFLDTDQNANTGCQAFLGTEYIMVFLPPGEIGPGFTLGDWRDCSAGDDFPGSVQSAIAGSFVEVAVRIDALRVLTPTMTGFRVWAESVPGGSPLCVQPGVCNDNQVRADFVLPPALYLVTGACQPGTPPRELCSGGIDEDCDDLVDCDDPDCSEDPSCAVAIAYIEVNQAVQRVEDDGRNTVPLVAYKDAIIRAYVEPASAAVTAVRGVTGTVHIHGPGFDLFSDAGPIGAVVNPLPEELGQTLNFLLIGDTRLSPGSYDVTVEARAGTARSVSKTIGIRVQRQRAISILYEPVKLDGVLPAGDFGQTYQLLKAVYPIPFEQKQWIPDTRSPLNLRTPRPFLGKLGCTLDASSILGALAARLTTFNAGREASKRADYVVGIIADDHLAVGGCSNRSKQAAFITDDSTESQPTLAHEIGHLLGLPVPSRCTIVSKLLLNCEEYNTRDDEAIGRRIDDGFRAPTPARKYYMDLTGGGQSELLSKVTKFHGGPYPGPFFNFMGRGLLDQTWVDEETYRFLLNALAQ